MKFREALSSTSFSVAQACELGLDPNFKVFQSPEGMLYLQLRTTEQIIGKLFKFSISNFDKFEAFALCERVSETRVYQTALQKFVFPNL